MATLDDTHRFVSKIFTSLISTEFIQRQIASNRLQSQSSGYLSEDEFKEEIYTIDDSEIKDLGDFQYMQKIIDQLAPYVASQYKQFSR